MTKPKRHVILIAYYFPPSEKIGGNRAFRFYKYLKRMGYLCHVITASEQSSNCPPEITCVTDRLQRRWEGAARQRFSFSASVELLVRKLAFPGQIGIMWSIAVAARCRQIIRDNPEHEFVIVCSYPALGVLLAGLIIAAVERIPWIADFRDPIAGLLLSHTPGYARFWDRVVERAVFRSAAAIVANTEGAATIWRFRYPCAHLKLHVIPNGFDPEDAPQPLEIPTRPEKLIVHAGTLYHGRNPNAVVRSLSRLRDNGVPEASVVRILLTGSIASNSGLDLVLCEQARRDGWLELREPVPREECLRILAEADGFLMLQPQSGIQVPAKLFEYICIGRPILALLHRSSSVAEILRNSGVPYVCIHPEDEPELIDHQFTDFLRLPTSPTPSSEWFKSNFSVEYQTQALSLIIESLG
ncbi:MAG: glycosyltransferase [Acidobacteriaceae bacterium]|nr:glycosyltransferase [Acidobacteriaceae bacterium]